MEFAFALVCTFLDLDFLSEHVSTMPLNMLWSPALHPNARRYTLAQDRVYRRSYPEAFPSIKKANTPCMGRCLPEQSTTVPKETLRTSSVGKRMVQ